MFLSQVVLHDTMDTSFGLERTPKRGHMLLLLTFHWNRKKGAFFTALEAYPSVSMTTWFWVLQGPAVGHYLVLFVVTCGTTSLISLPYGEVFYTILKTHGRTEVFPSQALVPPPLRECSSPLRAEGLH